MYLLDTNHCSRAILGDSNIMRRIAEAENTLMTTCVIVQGELIDMAERSQRRESNLALVQHPQAWDGALRCANTPYNTLRLCAFARKQIHLINQQRLNFLPLCNTISISLLSQ